MLEKKLNKYNIILGSRSPRRRELLSDLGLNFKVIPTNQEEKFPKKLQNEGIAEFLAKQKTIFLSNHLKNNDLLITADTIVIFNHLLLNKPKNNTDAFKILSTLSNNAHKVITGVCIKTLKKEVVFSTTTKITFKKLSDQEINYYITNYNPLDKAGSYGIQDWIGKIGIINIEGSYSNVVGLPLNDLYENLKKFK